MSGPKYSTAVINTRKLQELINELDNRIEENKCIQLRTEANKQADKVMYLAKRFLATYSKNIITMGSDFISDDPDFLLLQETLKEIEHFSSVQVYGTNSSDLIECCKELSDKLSSLQGKIAVFNTVSERVKSKINEKYLEAKENAFAEHCFEKNELPETMLSGKTYSLYLELIELLACTTDYESVKMMVDSIVHNHTIDESYKQKMLTNRIESLKACQDTDSDVMELKATVISLLILTGKEELLLPDTYEDLMRMKTELEEELHQKEADKYISTTVQSVLEDIGFNIVGTETVKHKTGKSTESITCDYSNDSVLRTATSEGGAVMFEIMSRKDNSEINDSDKRAVRIDMEHFCPEYAIVKDRLAEKGISLTGEKLCEPSEIYVRGSGFGGCHTESERRKKTRELKHYGIS